MSLAQAACAIDYGPHWQWPPAIPSTNGVCPGCGRCRTCGQGYGDTYLKPPDMTPFWGISMPTTTGTPLNPMADTAAQTGEIG